MFHNAITMKFTPFAKQLFVATSPLLAALSVGGAVSFPTVLLHQLNNNGSSIHLDMDTSSWIGSIHGLAGIPSILLPTIMQWRGRKFAFISACLITILGWIIAYIASNITALLISESLHGLGTNSILAVSYLCITEMISLEYRQTYMQTYAVLQTVTMALNGLLTQYLHWKTICLLMCVPMIIALVIAFNWPESPYWLALKGEYDECEKSFQWLRGTSPKSKKELELLIFTQKENSIADKDYKNISLNSFCNTIRRRDFYLPSFHMLVLQYLFYWSGNYVVLIYSIELIQKTTQNSDVSAFGALIMNSLLCTSIIISLFLNRYYKKKNILLCCCVIIVVAMSSIAAVTFLQSVGYMPRDSMLCLYFLIADTIASGVGVVSFAYNIAIEIMPVKHRGLGGALFVVCSCLLHSSSLKFAPYLFLYINMWGTFLFYAINTLVSGLFVWKYVPDTTGRTLQELEQYYMTGKFDQEPIDFEECQLTKPMVRVITDE